MDTEWFKARMKQLRVNQSQLAKAINRDRAVISRLLKGERKFELWMIQPLARTLQVTPREIVERAGLPAEIFGKGEILDLAEMVGDPRRTPTAPPLQDEDFQQLMLFVDVILPLKAVFQREGTALPPQIAVPLAQRAAALLHSEEFAGLDTDRAMTFAARLLAEYHRLTAKV